MDSATDALQKAFLKRGKDEQTGVDVQEGPQACETGEVACCVVANSPQKAQIDLDRAGQRVGNERGATKIANNQFFTFLLFYCQKPRSMGAINTDLH